LRKTCGLEAMQHIASAHAEESIDSTDALHFKPRGSNHTGMRQFNERVVLHAIRLHGAQPKAEVARLTRLSTQTVSLIIDKLIADDLVMRLGPVRGKVGQPSVPIALNPDGAFSIGIKIGRRSCDCLLLDFTGAVRARASLAYDFPEPEALFAHIQAQLIRLPATLGKIQNQRLYGIGVAAPLSLDGWQDLLGVDVIRTQRWSTVNIQERIAGMTALPVRVVKDTAAACVAELVAGHGRSVPSFLYIFIDTFIGGGLVIDSHLRLGLHGNAGAIGSMPLALNTTSATSPAQLLSAASLMQLEHLYQLAGLATQAHADARALQAPWQVHSFAWIAGAAPAIAMCIVQTSCLLDMNAVVLDGSIGRELLEVLSQAVKQAIQAYNWQGTHPPAIHIGTMGADARAMGGGLLPLYSEFAPDQDLFLK
jgi:predicted NBD/HSP70 family sugar kinase